ncbi:MAG TPA: hypothetical protein PJ986_14120 [Gammaproteobacteria bacterium]|nr:hypothetical protein [Gammaproteobacteria bacterium]
MNIQLSQTEVEDCARILLGALEDHMSEREGIVLMDIAIEHARSRGVDVEAVFEHAQRDPLLETLVRHPAGTAALFATLAARGPHGRRGPPAVLGWIQGGTLFAYCPACGDMHRHGSGGARIGRIEDRVAHCDRGSPIDYSILPVPPETWPMPTAKKPGRGRKPRDWKPSYEFH